MGAPDTGPKARKFTDSDVMAVFDEEQRRSIGKIELTATEVTEILNNQILPEGTTVTRQAVDKRLTKLASAGQLVKTKHGRSYHYRRPDDMERLFREEPPTTAPPAGGGSGGGFEEDTPTPSTSTVIDNLAQSNTWFAGIVVSLMGGLLAVSPVINPLLGIEAIFGGVIVVLLGAFTMGLNLISNLAIQDVDRSAKDTQTVEPSDHGR